MSDYTPTKRCTKCDTEFPATEEYFYRNGKSLQGCCKACTRANVLEYRSRNIEKIRAYKHEQHRLHPEKARQRARDYYQANTEKCRTRVYVYKKEHKDKDHEWKLQWKRKHPENARITKHTRRARERSAISSFTEENWLRALEYFDNRCAVCGRPRGLWNTLSQDHWIPLSKGGNYTPDNIVPLCHDLKDGMGGCNNSKRDSDPHEWLVKHFGKYKAAMIEKRIQTYFEAVALGL